MINEISLRLSPTHKQQIKQMNENAYDLQKQNRMRWANLIMKQSDLSSRRHKLSQEELKYAKFNEEKANRQNSIEKYNKEIENYKTQINLIKKQILIENKNYQLINEKISNLQIPNLHPLKTSISSRKKKVLKILDYISTNQKQIKKINNQKKRYIKAINDKQKLISDYETRVSKANCILQHPIDDLRIEEITVTKLENYISQIENETDLNDIDESSTIEEELLIKTIETENIKRKKRIEQIKSNIQHIKSSLSNQSTTPSRNSSPKKNYTSTQIEYDQDRLDQFNSIITSFQERQKMIDEVEEMTTRYQIAWISDQKQIEESWMLKMNDMQDLQNRIDEIEQLIMDIDEISDQIVQLKETQIILDDERNEFQKEQSKLQLKISGIGLEHNSMKDKINDWLQKKEFVDEQKEKLNQKRQIVHRLDDDVHQLEEKYKAYREYVKSLELQVRDTKQSFNLNKSHNNIEFRNHIKFSSSVQKKFQKKTKTPMPKKQYKPTNIEMINDSNIEAENAIKAIQQLIGNSNQSKNDNEIIVNDEDSQRSEIEIDFSDEIESKALKESNQSHGHAISTLKMSEKHDFTSNYTDKFESSKHSSYRQNSFSNRGNSLQRLNSPSQSHNSTLKQVNSPSKPFNSPQKVVTAHSVFHHSNRNDSNNHNSSFLNQESHYSTFQNDDVYQNVSSEKNQNNTLHVNDILDSIHDQDHNEQFFQQKSTFNDITDLLNTNSQYQTTHLSNHEEDIAFNSERNNSKNVEKQLNSEDYNLGEYDEDNQFDVEEDNRQSNSEVSNQFNPAKNNQIDVEETNQFDVNQIHVEEEEERLTYDDYNQLKYEEDNQVNSKEEDPLSFDNFNQINIEEEEEEQSDETSNATYETTINQYFPLHTNQTNQDLYSMGFPTPEHFDSSVVNNEVSASYNSVENNNYQTEYKDISSNQGTPIKQSIRSISKITEDLQTPNRTNRYSHTISLENDESDQEFNLLIEEAQNAIKLPLLQSKYLQS